MTIQLTQDQKNAYQAISDLLMSKTEHMLVISGFAGTGKTTLIDTVMREWPQLHAMGQGNIPKYDFHLTATTNKAADALANATGRETGTIHAFLGLRVQNLGYNKTRLVDNRKQLPSGYVLVIDESSFIDDELLDHIMHKTKGNKVIFLGDQYQLKPVGSDLTPVFDSGLKTSHLTKIVRQSDNSPIQKLSVALRGHVAGDPMPKAGVNGTDIIHMPRDMFEQSFVNEAIIAPANSVRALAWTNKRAIHFNELVAVARSGSTEIKVGDTAVVNKQIAIRDKYCFPTDSTLFIAGLTPWALDSNGVLSRQVTTNYGHVISQAQNHQDAVRIIKKHYDDGNISMAILLENTYCDLRLMYASTVNKSQGSTYDSVYIDLDNIGACQDKDQVRRMLYVAVSRAKSKVVFTGDL